MTADAGELDLEVPASLHGERVDRALSLLAGVTRKVAADVVASGAVRVGDVVVRARSTTLRAGERLRASIPAATGEGPVADPAVEFGVVFEDDDVIVVDKPAGLVVHHGAGRRGGTLVDGLLARFPDLARLAEVGVGDATRPGIVHRLDKGTSGLLIVARSARAFDSLSRQLREHQAERRYLALAAGIVEPRQGIVDAPIGRSTRRPDRMAVRAAGRPARTRYEVRHWYRAPVEATLVEAALETGRTHQVRVHLAAIGHPVVGDDRYGGPGARPAALTARLGAGRLFLHAWRLSVEHPAGEPMSWESALPADLAAVLDTLD